MLAFIVYQTFYIGGNWSYVQRYTSVSNEKNSKKVAGIFTILYFVSPVIWMIPPMVYRIINPNLQGLDTEDAYMMLIEKVMPAGLIGLVLAGMVSATSSKANTTINMAATVFAQDIYQNLIRPSAPEKEVIWIARFFTLLFGIGTIVIAIWIPSAGGIVEVVLSTASIAGGALFAPIIWTLFSKRQTGFSVVTTTLMALGLNLFLKIACPALFHFKLNRTMETVAGMGIPVLLLGLFDLYYKLKGQVSEKAIMLAENISMKSAVEVAPGDLNKQHMDAEEQNIFGIRVIAAAMACVGIGIFILGALADDFSNVVMGVGITVLLLSLLIGRITITMKRRIKSTIPELQHV